MKSTKYQFYLFENYFLNHILFKNTLSRHENTTQLIKQQSYDINKIRNLKIKGFG
jgi:hypothetical protein